MRAQHCSYWRPGAIKHQATSIHRSDWNSLQWNTFVQKYYSDNEQYKKYNSKQITQLFSG